MVGRLSDTAVTATYDSGYRGLSWQPSKPVGFLAGIDFDQILNMPECRDAIQSLPVQAVYVGIKKRGWSESLEIIPHLSEDQFIRVFDFDVWKKDEIDRDKAFELLTHVAQLGPKELYKRYAYLDEEYQIALLSGLITVATEEEFEKFSQERQDEFSAMPCQQVYYRIEATDDNTVSLIESIIRASIEYNLRYAYALIAYAAHSVPNESEGQIEQFRRARMEEEGFVSYQESLTYFQPLDLVELETRWAVSEQIRGASVTDTSSSEIPFFNLTLDALGQANWDVDDQYNLHIQLLQLANSISSACQVEPDDATGISQVLEQCQAMVGLALDYLSGHSPLLAARILKDEHVKTLFRCGISLVERLRELQVSSIESLKLGPYNRIREAYDERKWGLLCYELDRHYIEILGLNLVEVLKGLFNRFPMTTQAAEDGLSIQFVPLFSFEKLQKLEVAVGGTRALFYMYSLIAKTSSSDKALSFELTLGQGLLSALVKGEFAFHSLDRNQLEYKLHDQDELNKTFEEFMLLLGKQVKEKQDEWTINTQHTSLSLAYGMKQFRDLTAPVMESMRSGNIPHGAQISEVKA